MAERVLVWGAGAIGGIAGAYLARADHDVTLVDVHADHVAAIRADGLKIEGPIETFAVSVPAFLPEEVRGTWPIVLLAVKAQATEAACRALAPQLAPGGVVISMQNGLCAPAMERALGRGRSLGTIVHYAGDWLEPGRIRFGMRGALLIGEFDGSMTPRLRAAEALLRAVEPDTEAVPDLAARIWSKLCFTALMIAQATGVLSIAECLEREDRLPLWRALVGEVLAVATAQGETPPALDGLDPTAFGPASSDAAARASLDVVIAHVRQGAKSHSGFWRDIAVRKRKTEAEAQLAPVLEIAAQGGVACPTLAALAAMIGEIEAGRRPQSEDNLLLLASAARRRSPSP